LIVRKTAKTTADELLADTRAYTSSDWKSFLYVIYETKRFKPEAEWRQLMRDCRIDGSTSVVVMTGEVIQRADTVTSRRSRKGKRLRN
jgi:hypothetical protein